MQIFGQLSTGDFVATVGSFGADLVRWFTTRADFDFAVGGIAFGFTISYFFEMFFGMFLLNRRIKVFSWKETFKPMLQKLFIGFISLCVMYLVYRLTDRDFDTTRTVSVFAVFAWTSAAGLVTYFGLSRLLKVPEIDTVLYKIKVLLHIAK